MEREGSRGDWMGSVGGGGGGGPPCTTHAASMHGRTRTFIYACIPARPTPSTATPHPPPADPPFRLVGNNECKMATKVAKIPV